MADLAAHPVVPGPPRYPTGQCSSSLCKATVIWAMTRNGDRMPVDVEPVGAGSGNVLLTFRGDGVAPRATVVTNPAELFGRAWVYRSHFATCVDADSFRRRAARRTGRRPLA